MSVHITEDIVDREIVSTRFFDVPRAVLFKAWSEPDVIAQWWGPKGFTTINKVHEFKPGGKWEFTMLSPNGHDHENECEFITINEPQKISWDHKTLPFFQVVVTFDDLGDRSKCTFRMLFESVAECDSVKNYVIPANEEVFDRLAGVLRQTNKFLN